MLRRVIQTFHILLNYFLQFWSWADLMLLLFKLKTQVFTCLWCAGSSAQECVFVEIVGVANNFPSGTSPRTIKLPLHSSQISFLQAKSNIIHRALVSENRQLQHRWTIMYKWGSIHIMTVWHLDEIKLYFIRLNYIRSCGGHCSVITSLNHW